MSKLIVILGITGNQRLVSQGSSVANTFLDLPGWKIRGITRDPSQAKAQELEARGIEMVKGDIEDKDSLAKAFTGANAIFALTDFWAGVFNPATVEAAKAAGRTINQYAYDREVHHGQNIADAAADPVVFKTLERFIYSTLSNARKWSGGKYTWVYHFDSKAQVVEYIKKSHPDLFARTSTVQIGEYANNWRKFAALAPHKQPDGSFLITKPHGGDAPIPMVVTQRDTGSFVWALVQSPPQTHLLGYGSLIGWEEYARVWGRILNVRAQFKQVPPEEYLKGALPEDLAREVRECHQYHAEFGWDGGDPDVKHPKDLEVDVPTTGIEEYIRSEDWSSLLQ